MRSKVINNKLPTNLTLINFPLIRTIHFLTFIHLQHMLHHIELIHKLTIDNIRQCIYELFAL